MAREGSIFRREAVEHRERDRGPGDVLRAAPGWTRWFFFVLIGLVLTALVAASVIEIDRYARGPTASDPEGRVVVLLPAAVAPNVAEGSRVELDGASARVVSSGSAVLSPTKVRERFGAEVAFPSIVVVTSATEETDGSARVLVESDPVIVQFVPGLDSLLGGNDA